MISFGNRHCLSLEKQFYFIFFYLFVFIICYARFQFAIEILNSKSSTHRIVFFVWLVWLLYFIWLLNAWCLVVHKLLKNAPVQILKKKKK